MTQDIRWIQRFNNFEKAFKQLESAIDIAKSRELTKLEKQGVIHCFEYSHELAWKVLKDFLTEQGVVDLIGSKDSTRAAFKAGIISDGEIWMEMIKARNSIINTDNYYNLEYLSEQILVNFFPAFLEFKRHFLNYQETYKLQKINNYIINN